MSEESITRQQSGLVGRHKSAVGTPQSRPRACSGDKFVVSRAGGAYKVQRKNLNRRFRLICIFMGSRAAACPQPTLVHPDESILGLPLQYIHRNNAGGFST